MQTSNSTLVRRDELWAKNLLGERGTERKEREGEKYRYRKL